MKNDSEENKTQLQQNGDNNISFQNSTINIIVKKLNDRMNPQKSTGLKTNDDVAGKMFIGALVASLIMAGYLMYQHELFLYGWVTVVFFWGLAILRILKLKKNSVYRNLNFENRLSLNASMSFWLAIGGVMYFLDNPLYQPIQASEVKMYIVKEGFSGILSRIIETYIEHPSIIISFVLQSLSYITLALIAVFLILDYMSFSITILSGRLQQNSLAYKIVAWFGTKMEKFKINKSAVVSFSLIIIIAFLSGSGIFTMVVEHAQQVNTEILTSYYKP
ncbi:hypothetical protein [Paenibacillus oleatilyticus]|uniref:Uncharacterized protein n=1 Tax=Paenibacillus oleatilyticus TaxID=2594886 RepID=A0ABV4V211_9BACL